MGGCARTETIRITPSASLSCLASRATPFAEVEAALRGRSRFELEDRAAKAGALVFAVAETPAEWRKPPATCLWRKQPTARAQSRRAQRA